jgi:transposase-like protein
MDESSGSKRGEAREFWEAAIRLWTDSGLSVREFCIREGLTEHTFYSWRRELLPGSPPPEANQESSATDGEVIVDRRRRRKPKRVAADNMPEAAASFIELVAPTPAGLCHCTLELENTGGAKMRIQLRSVAMPDLAAISRSFWNQPS